MLGLRFCARAFSSVASGGHSSSRCTGLSLLRPLLLWSTGSRRAGSVVVAHKPGCSVACGIFPDQGLNPCPLHWQADSQPLRHQGSPLSGLLLFSMIISRSIHVAANSIISFFMANIPSYIYTISSLSIHLSLFLIYLFLAALGLRCCTQAFSSCGKWGPLFVAVCRLLIAVASLIVEHRL